MMRINRIIIYSLSFLLISACNQKDNTTQASPDYSNLTIQTATGEHKFRVELADTKEKAMLGLMYRKSMPDDEGMIFDFGETREVYMWMKNTYIPLDMLFISHEGVIVDIKERATPLSENIISAKVPAYSVLEINGGIAEKIGAKEGDKVIHSIFDKKKDSE